MKTLWKGGGFVPYPVNAPTPDTIKFNSITSKEVQEAYRRLISNRLLMKIDHEFRTVIKVFCGEFENTKVRSVENIINFDKENKDAAMAERKNVFSC